MYVWLDPPLLTEQNSVHGEASISLIAELENKEGKTLPSSNTLQATEVSRTSAAVLTPICWKL